MPLYSERGVCLHEVKSHPPEVIFWAMNGVPWSCALLCTPTHHQPPPDAAFQGQRPEVLSTKKELMLLLNSGRN